METMVVADTPIKQWQQSSAVRRLLVVGIGNILLGDDGVGIHVVRELQAGRRSSALPEEGIEFVDGGTLGYLLIDRLAGVDGLIIVDSAKLKADAGTVRVFQGQSLGQFFAENASSSVHEAGLIDLLQMMSLCAEAPARLALVGIQPGVIAWGTELSPSVAAAVPEAEQAVADILESWREQQRNPCPD